jgi:pimeloyl-ACP methyl ester carboxylesterase
MNTPIILAATHGILTGQTDPSWPDRLDAWFAARFPSVRVLKKEYTAGPFPRLNCWLKNPRLAKALANEIEVMLGAFDQQSSAPPSIWLVAHSNGALIAVNTAQVLIDAGHSLGGIILIGGACGADARRTGVLDWVESGRLNAAFAYCSPQDRALPGAQGGNAFQRIYRLAAWPYGCLGRTGWLLDGRGFPTRPGMSESGCISTRWFGGGHSGYFAPSQMEYTFRQIAADIFTAEARRTQSLSTQPS